MATPSLDVVKAACDPRTSVSTLATPHSNVDYSRSSDESDGSVSGESCGNSEDHRAPTRDEWDLLSETFDRVVHTSSAGSRRSLASGSLAPRSQDSLPKSGQARSQDQLPKFHGGVIPSAKTVGDLPSMGPSVGRRSTTMDLPSFSTSTGHASKTLGDLPGFQPGRRASACGLPSLSELPEHESAKTLEECYDIFNVCGKGNSGVVRYAEHRLSGKKVVVKSCRKIQMGKEAWETLLAGSAVHQNLSHRRIVKMDDLYTTPIVAHMALERLEGGNLQKELDKRGRFSEEQASYIMRQLLEALDYIHGEDIVHRDIKLENIMLEQQGELDVKLIDFGFATAWDGLQKMSLKCGTIPYAAPELLNGAYTEKADVWAAGVVAHALLTGELVYSGSMSEIRAKAKEGRPVLSEKLKDCSAGAQEFVKALLAHDPVQRVSAEEALGHPWL